jgi:hypothetical protein
LGGHATEVSRQRHRGAVVAVLATLIALSIAACGDEPSSDANEAEGTYRVQVTGASFPTKQQLGQTYLLKLGVRNTGDKTIPALTVNASIKGEEGEGSTLPFGIHDPQPELAQPDRPVWVLAEHYPKFVGSSANGGAATSNPKTFDFGPLKKDATANVVWKLSAVRAGSYTLVYGIEAGLSDKTKAETGSGVAPGGSISVKISSAERDTEVTDSGEVVEKK